MLDKFLTALQREYQEIKEGERALKDCVLEPYKFDPYPEDESPPNGDMEEE